MSLLSLLKTLFGGSKNSEEVQSAERQALTHPRDLRKGDIIKFGFLPQEELSNARFEVVAVNTYDFDRQSYSLTLKGDKDNRIWLTVNSEDGEEYLAIAKKLTREQVKSVFSPDEFAQVFQEGAGTELDVRSIPEGFAGWLSDALYTEAEDCSQGYYHEGDLRYGEARESYPLDFYLLEDDSEEFAVEIEVYEEGETEVSGVVYHPVSAIEEMWPGG